MSDSTNVPTYQQALEAAGLEKEVGTDDLLDKQILILEWAPDAKIVPQTRTRTQGYTVKGEFVDTQERFKVFIGGQVLVKELTALAPPFTTTIRRSGQTYRFS